MSKPMVIKSKEYSKTLDREVGIFIMLPKNYNSSNKTYPVLYMHDGQNLFYDEDASFGVSWGILQAYETEEMPEIIIAGFSCAEGNGRLDEYSPWQNNTISKLYPGRIEGDVGGKGDLYLKYLTEEMIPFVESTYPASKAVEDRAIGGSSMGGLISTYAITAFKHYFTRAFCVSNAYWFAIDEILEHLKNSSYEHIKYFYMDVGTNEIEDNPMMNDQYMGTNDAVYTILKEKLSKEQLRYDVIQGGKHHESHWSMRIGDIIRFIYQDKMK